jgi:DNA-binding transcriptional MerR regulator
VEDRVDVLRSCTVTDLHARLRTADVARAAGWSVQQVRDLEAEGVLAPAPRTASGHRLWHEGHVRGATAYRHLSAALGPAPAAALLRTARTAGTVPALHALDAAHADLHAQRLALAAAVTAAALVAAEPVDDALPADAMGTAELARALGVRASTLRHWHAEGLVAPERGPGGARSWSPAQVRTVRVVHQLRLAGHPVPAVRAVVAHLGGPGGGDGGGWEEVTALLRGREADLDRRSRALLRGGALLDALLGGSAPGG